MSDKLKFKVLNDFLKNSEFEMQVCKEKWYILIVFDGGIERKGDKWNTFILYAGALKSRQPSVE